VKGGDGERGRGPGDLSTRAVHAGREAGGEGRPVVPSIVQSATFLGGGPGDEGAIRYTRYGNNPNQLLVGEKIASLEGMESGLALGSGMGAISASLLSLLAAGDHLVTSRYLYGATQSFMVDELPRRGVGVTFVDPDDEGVWERARTPETRAFYLEMPTNPTLRVFDPRPVAAIARAAGLPLVMDVTFASPVNLNAGALGADLVIHSATKYLGGHSDLIAGVVAGSAELIQGVRRMLHLYGAALDPHAAWLLDRGMRTLPVRIERHNANAMALARWFREHPAVLGVVYPGLPDHPDHALASELLSGFGGMLGIVLAGGRMAAERFCLALELAAVAPSLGGVETLVSIPRLTSHRTFTPGELARAGIEDGFVRISVGIEGLNELQDDFRKALDAC